MKNASLTIVALTVVAAAWATDPSAAQEADAASGERLFRQRCGACHQIATTRNGAGPHLQSVVGRAAGSVEGFNYSPALRDSGITWTADTLESYTHDSRCARVRNHQSCGILVRAVDVADHGQRDKTDDPERGQARSRARNT